MDIMVRALLIVCLGLCTAFGVSRCQYKELQTYTAEYQTEVYKKLVDANMKAREIELAKQKQVNTIGSEYEKAIQVIQLGHKAELAAAIKSGTIKLRDHWQSCAASSDVSGNAGTASTASNQDELRAEDIGYLRELGAIADAREQAFQEYAQMCIAQEVSQK